MIYNYTINHQGSMEIEKTTVLILIIEQFQLPDVQMRLVPQIHSTAVQLYSFMCLMSSMNFFTLLLLLDGLRMDRYLNLDLLRFRRSTLLPLFNFYNHRISSFFLNKLRYGSKWFMQDMPINLYIFNNRIDIFCSIMLQA